MNHTISCYGFLRLIAFREVSHNVLDAHIPQENIGRVYDRIAHTYNVWGKLTESHARNRAIEIAQIEDGQNILEVAVGTGLAFYEIVKRNPGGMNAGIDLSKEMLRKAKKRLQGLSGVKYTLQQGSAFELPIENNSIDTLINNYMFDLIPYDDMNRLLIEFKRVLKVGGKLVLVNMTKGESLASNLYDMIYRYSPIVMGGCRRVQLSEKLQANGFTVEVREYYQQMLFPSEVILARK